MKITIEAKEYSSHEELSKKDQDLISFAIKHLDNSHSPYSNFKVGAAVRLENGKIWGGSNQENSSFPVGICAERVAISTASSQSPRVSMNTIAIVYSDNENNHDSPLAPCGMCRQAIREQTLIQKAPIKLILTTLHGRTSVISNADDLLPLSFTLKN
tara:strand:+ start:189 stop:659 length:471 start_codon:yes stop_codon:yes gene_type:complete